MSACVSFIVFLLTYDFDAKDIILVLGKFSIINVILSANIDVFLNAFLSALDVASPGVAAQIGKG